MRSLKDFRSGKPNSYPDQSVYAEYACAEFGLSFKDIDGGTGLVFSVASNAKTVHFGAGRCSWYPQNNATAATLASDKYFTNTILERAGIASSFAFERLERGWDVSLAVIKCVSQGDGVLQRDTGAGTNRRMNGF